ncbi:MAG: hypothetical protein IJM76_10590 [Lachnospiraceae bacterium]|nr:hypothetical protein [Lachnospiraceae bacterium]
MGLLSKLLGGQKNEKAAVDFLKGLVNEVKEKAADELSQDRREERSMPENEGNADAVSGDSWGDVMPPEENQYSFNGSYVEYFDKVFREEFPSYRIEHAPAPKGRRATIFTFYNAQGKALVVELMSENSVARMLRQECAAENIPYLRFYYDHQGWWNTRSYVVRRTLAALRG